MGRKSCTSFFLTRKTNFAARKRFFLRNVWSRDAVTPAFRDSPTSLVVRATHGGGEGAATHRSLTCQVHAVRPRPRILPSPPCVRAHPAAGLRQSHQVRARSVQVLRRHPRESSHGPTSSGALNEHSSFISDRVQVVESMRGTSCGFIWLVSSKDVTGGRQSAAVEHILVPSVDAQRCPVAIGRCSRHAGERWARSRWQCARAQRSLTCCAAHGVGSSGGVPSGAVNRGRATRSGECDAGFALTPPAW